MRALAVEPLVVLDLAEPLVVLGPLVVLELAPRVLEQLHTVADGVVRFADLVAAGAARDPMLSGAQPGESS